MPRDTRSTFGRSCTFERVDLIHVPCPSNGCVHHTLPILRPAPDTSYVRDASTRPALPRFYLTPIIVSALRPYRPLSFPTANTVTPIITSAITIWRCSLECFNIETPIYTFKEISFDWHGESGIILFLRYKRLELSKFQ